MPLALNPSCQSPKEPLWQSLDAFVPEIEIHAEIEKILIARAICAWIRDAAAIWPKSRIEIRRSTTIQMHAVIRPVVRLFRFSTRCTRLTDDDRTSCHVVIYV